MKKGNVNKWDLPGWKFEPGYSSRTLVGDWFEERNTVSKSGQWKNDCTRTFEYRIYLLELVTSFVIMITASQLCVDHLELLTGYFRENSVSCGAKSNKQEPSVFNNCFEIVISGCFPTVLSLL